MYCHSQPFSLSRSYRRSRAARMHSFSVNIGGSRPANYSGILMNIAQFVRSIKYFYFPDYLEANAIASLEFAPNCSTVRQLRHQFWFWSSPSHTILLRLWLDLIVPPFVWMIFREERYCLPMSVHSSACETWHGVGP